MDYDAIVFAVSLLKKAALCFFVVLWIFLGFHGDSGLDADCKCIPYRYAMQRRQITTICIKQRPSGNTVVGNSLRNAIGINV